VKSFKRKIKLSDRRGELTCIDLEDRVLISGKVVTSLE
jgi:hypothetical protein